MKLETLLFGDYSKREIKKISPIADKVEALADKYRDMDDEELSTTSEVLRARLDGGETLDDILPDAFAAVRETADRVLGKRPFHVQIIGGILLHQGRISEMKTGEGKTLVATMPAYLNALTGKGVHVVTVNEYLAKRDKREMGKIYEFLGLKTGVILRAMNSLEKKINYACDITYGTSSEFGFDYLRDNIAKSSNAILQRGHNYCIVDEIDSILIDESKTPLIISGVAEKTKSEFYSKGNDLVRKMKKKVLKEMDSKMGTDDESLAQCDYVVDEKAESAILTPRGVEAVEKYFGIEHLYREFPQEKDSMSEEEKKQYEEEHDEALKAANILEAVEQLIHAWGVKKRDVDYAVLDGKEVVIIDRNTGRLMPGRRYHDGLHQAIEVKEGVNVQGDSRVVATITLQNYFRMYSKLSGMTGTAKTEENEFRQVYGMDVIEVPTHMKMIRVDNPDRFFMNEEQKFAAIVRHVKECHEKDQPVLIGTSSVEKSEKLGKMMKSAGLKFNMLNAKEHEREAKIIANAGLPGAITLATNMAGRGTDIMLGGNPEIRAKETLRDEKEFISFCNMHQSISATTAKGFTTRSNLTVDDWLACVTSKNANRGLYVIRGLIVKNADLKKHLRNQNALYNKCLEEYKQEAEISREKVIESGGLCVIGSERHESRRIDNQLRGRSGRQGDPGSSTFYVSLGDDIMRLFGDDRLRSFFGLSSKIADEYGDISQNMKLLSDVLEKAQKNVEARHFNARKNVLQYDDILNEQRKQIFALRDEILRDGDISEKILHMIGSTVEDTVEEHTFLPQDSKVPEIDIDGLIKKYWFCQLSREDLEGKNGREIIEYITEKAKEIYRAREAQSVLPDGRILMREFERHMLLNNMDERWLDHIDAMNDIKDSIGFQAYAQKDPLKEYKIMSASMFAELINEIRQGTVRSVLTEKIVIVEQPESAARNLRVGNEKTASQGTVVKRGTKIRPNDPCPCGSGKKYKKCCGAGGGDN